MRPRAWEHGIIAWLVRHRVAPNLLMLMLIVGGLLMSREIKQEVFPEFELDMVVVSVVYPDSSPEEVERGIVLAVESAIRGVDGISEINATASEGSARLLISLEEGIDRQKALDDVIQEVDAIDTFPEDAEDPKVVLASRRRQVLYVNLYGDVTDSALRDLGMMVRDRLLLQPGISQIDLQATRDPEIRVEVPLANLRAHGLTLAEVADRIGDLAVEVPGGTVRARSGDILLRVENRQDWAREFADLPILTTESGGVLRLDDIAVVRDTLEESDRFQIVNGKPGVALAVYRIGDQTPIGVSEAVRAAMPGIAAELPPGVSWGISADRSSFYQQRLELLMRNGLIGLALVMLLLGTFLNFKVAFWVTMGIPTAFLGALLFLPWFGVSINMISMFAFIIALGIVVDDAIIAGENIYEYRQRGMPFIEAAIRGARDIAMPITFAILTNVVAFVPLYFVPGVMGNVFGVIPMVVVTVFLLSWVEALLILPAHLGHSRRGTGNPVSRFLVARQESVAVLLTRFVDRIYRPFLEVCVHWRYVTVAVSIGILILVLTFAMSGRMGFILMPRAEADSSYATAVLPIGTPRARSLEVRDRLLDAAADVAAAHGGADLVESTWAQIDESEIDVRVSLTAPDLRPISTTEFTSAWRDAVGILPGVESVKFESDRGGPGGGSGLNVELSHADIDVLERAAADLAATLAEFPQVSDVDDGSAAGKRQVSFRLRSEGLSLGLTDYDVARQIRAAFAGIEALRQQRGTSEVTVRVQLPRAERIAERDIEDFLVRTPAGTYVPLREVADVTWGRAYTSIERRDGRRAVTVSGEVTPIRDTSTIKNTLTKDILPALKRHYPGLTHDFRGRSARMQESMSSLKTNFVFALLAIYVLLAIPFRDYIQPLIVMTALPLGFVGAVIGHLIMGYSLSVVSIMGVIALSGVVINDSLVMIDYANRQRAAGMAVREAVLSAGVRRFRPILLTTLTTFGGLAPMIFETSRQARFMVPMALSLGYGILFATAIILVFVPSLYLIFEDIKALFGSSEASDDGAAPGEVAR